MVQINKYNAINSIKTTSSQNLKKLRGRANRGKEQDYNKRDVKRGGGGGASPVLERKHAARPRKSAYVIWVRRYL